MADTLAALHAVDPDAVGLGDLGRHDGYIERQLKRWSGQYDQMQVEGVDHGGLVEQVERRAGRGASPPQQRTSVVHGDYRLDNVVLADDGDGAGHPRLGDLHAGRPPGRPRPADGLLGRPRRREAVLGLSPRPRRGSRTPGRGAGRATRAVSDRDVSGVGYYIAFGYWKLACILQGVYARYVAGAGAGDQGSVDGVPGPDRPAGSSWRPTRWRRRREPRGRADRDLRGPPRARPRRPGPGGRPRGLGRRRARGDDGRRHAARADGAHRAARHLQRRALPRPAGAAAGGPHRQRRHHRADLAPHRLRQGQDEAGATCSSWSAPSPTSTGATSPTPWSGWPARWRVRMVVGLGAFPAPAPHTRPVKLAATAPAASADLIEQVGHRAGRARGAGRGDGRARAGLRRGRARRWSACGPGCPTTWRACPSPRPAPR